MKSSFTALTPKELAKVAPNTALVKIFDDAEEVNGWLKIGVLLLSVSPNPKTKNPSDAFLFALGWPKSMGVPQTTFRLHEDL
jgi:hypothetical protein